MNYSIRLISTAAFCMLMMGCGSAEVQNPPTSPVTGKVTYNGEAVEGATIKFVPSNAEAKSANNVSAADGTYALSTFESGDGAMAGKFKVTVRKLVNVEEGVQEDGENAGEPNIVSKDMLPIKYRGIGDTPLEFEVTADGENTFNIELTD
ncbi:MAG: hypothetical protein ACKVKT_10555 [Rhodospirillales bacterium]